MEGTAAMEETTVPALSKKEKAKLEKLAKKNLHKQMAGAQLNVEEEDPLAANYGDVALENLQSKERSGRGWSKVGDIAGDVAGQTVLVRGRVHTVRGKGSLAFFVVRETGYTVQCVAQLKDKVVSKGMIKFVTKLNKESIVDVEGVVVVPAKPVETSQKVSARRKFRVR